MTFPENQTEIDQQNIEIKSQVRISQNQPELGKSIHILHVDDEPCILVVSKQILELEGNFRVDSVSSVKEAEEKLSLQKYDAIISDYEMPGKNGLQFLKELREEPNDIPFIIFTGKGREDVVIQALNLGAGPLCQQSRVTRNCLRRISTSSGLCCRTKKSNWTELQCGDHPSKP